MNKLLMAGVAAVLVFATQPLLADDATTTTPAAAPAAPAADADPVVAIVNGTPLHRSDVVASARGLPEQYQQQIDLIFPALVERLVGLELLAQAGRDANLANDPEVQKMMKVYEGQAIRQVYMTNLIHDGVTDEEVKKRYDAYVAANPPKTEIHARHILLKTKEEAVAVIAELDKGANFAELAKTKSTDPAASNGGDLGYFLPEEMVKPFADAALALEKGKYTETPVQTEFGWHVIFLEDKRERKPPTLDEMKQELQSQIAEEIVGKKVEALRATAKVELFNPDGTPRPDTPPAPADGGAAAPATDGTTAPATTAPAQ
ncbi:peptidylprolyl isomerase [Hypericibacter sp.]|uniref:peptidylprolyl isomerase n=1 Tax=Hypericibacter sp. TaxID=2705401 RepID=UPI003D6D5FCB